MNPGDIVRVNCSAPFDVALPPQSIGVMIEVHQRYWDYGDGECGYVEVADVMSNGQIFEIACTHLAPVDK
jgi:hypothetical protein